MKSRLLIVIAFAALGLVLAGGPAAAAETQNARGITEIHTARAMLDRSLTLYEAGRADAAFTAARTAYLDHFELVEIPLRVRNESLTLSTEEKFAELRNLIRARADTGDVRAKVIEIRQALDESERALSQPGIGAPAMALGFSFITLFREGLEAVLVVAAILGFLEASRNTRYKGAVLKGVGVAVVATVVTFVLVTAVIQLAPVERELLEAATTLIAVAVLFYVSFWLVARLEQRRWMEFLNAKVWAAATTGSTVALAGVGFTAVYREGVETTLFYQALLFFARGLEGWVWAGAGLAVVALAGIGIAIFRAGRTIPVRQFLGIAVGLVMVLSVAFIGNAVRGLQEAAIVPVTFLSAIPRLPIFLSELTGLHPTAQTISAQVALAAIYTAGAIWVFVIRPRGERGERARVAVTEPQQ